MLIAPLPENEFERIETLKALAILDTPAEDEFEALVKAASIICDVPISLISLIDSDRQWFKANHGLQGQSETHRDVAFCSHTIQDTGLFEVEDATKDQRFHDNPLVTKDPKIRFYAGVSLTLKNGANIGTLCVIDNKPQKLDDRQKQTLQFLALSAVAALEKRRDYINKSQQLLSLATELSASETRYKTLCNSTSFGIFETDAYGNCTYTNRKWHSISGLNFDQSLGQGWQQSVHPEDLEEVAETWKADSLIDKEYCYKFRVIHVKGGIKSLRVIAKPILSALGEHIGWMGSIEDLSSLYLARKEAKRREDRFRKNYENTPAIMHTIDLTGNIVNVSQLWLSTTGYELDEVVGQPSHKFLTPASKLYAKTVAIPKLMKEQVNNNVAMQMVKKDGTVLDILLSAVIESDEQGKPISALAVIRDVTKERADQLFKEGLLETIRNEFITSTVDRQGNIIEVNKAFCDICKYSSKELLGRNHRIINSGYHPVSFFEEMWATISSGKTWHGEICNRAKDGSLYWVDSVITPFVNSSGEIIRYVSIRKDVTERKKQDEIIKKTQSLLEHTGIMAKVGGWEVDLLNNSIYWSDQTCLIHGMPPGHKPKMEDALNFYAPEARPIVQEAIENAIAKKVSWDLKLPFIQADGTAIWVRAQGNPKYDSNGNVVGLIGAFQDITHYVKQNNRLKVANQRISLATESGGIGIWEFQPKSCLSLWDENMFNLYGLKPHKSGVKYEDWLQYVHIDDRSSLQSKIENSISHRTSLETEYRIVRADGTMRYLKLAARIVEDENQNDLTLLGVNWDITSLRELASKLASQHELLRVTLKSIGDAVITTDEKGNVDWLNPVAERLTGWSTIEAKGRPLPHVFNIVNEDTRLKTENPVATALEQKKVVGLANHTLLISKDGDEYGIEDSAAPIKNEKGELLGGVLVFHDVTEQRRLSGEVSYQAKHDNLTGLINRSEFDKCLRNILHETHEKHSIHALMYIDLDQFKIVNDTCGHTIGDQLLINVGKLLGSSLRSSDLLARLGGDEFGIILRNCSIEQSTKIANDICKKMESYRFSHETHRFRIGTSIGLVKVDRSWQTISAIMQAADAACYAAKDAGKNRVHTWFDTDKAMRERQGEMQWANRIENAIDQNQFVLYVQQIEKISNNTTGIHAEVLLRMVEQDGNIVLPGSFIPAAERYQLAPRLDRWVMRNTIEYLQQHKNIDSIEMICINLSGQSIGDRAFHRDVTDLLIKAGERICYKLCIEITETAVVTNIADAALFIEQVHDLGVKVALDDFGAGASSFGYLKHLKVDILKIDGQFIQNIVDDLLNDSAVRSFIDVAKVVGLETIAEYVENPAVLSRIKELGVDYAQGYLIHKPEPIEKVLNLMKSA